MVPNPAEARMTKALSAARADLAAAKEATTTDAREGRSASVRPIDKTAAELAALRAESATIPAKVPFGDMRPHAVRLDDERKRLHDAVRMATWDAEHALARALGPHHPRGRGRSPQPARRGLLHLGRSGGHR